MESKEEIRNRAIKDRKIIIKGAREHNLQNIDVTIPGKEEGFFSKIKHIFKK